MNKSYQYLDIDINKKIYRRLNAVQGDTKSRYILVSLYNNSIAFDLSNCSVKVFGVKSDKKIFFNYANIIDASKGQFEIELTSQALAVNGELQIQILVLGANQERLTTCTFFIDVDRTIVDDNAIQSENEFTALTKGLADLAEYDTYKNNILKHDEKLIKHEDKLNEVSSQLEHIVYEVEKPITLNKCNEEMLMAIQNKEGETSFNLLSIPRNSSVSSLKLDKNNNIIDDLTFRTGYALKSDGSEMEFKDFSTSDYYDISCILEITLNNDMVGSIYPIQGCFYDSDKNFISTINSTKLGLYSIKKPKNAKYLKINYHNKMIESTILYCSQIIPKRFKINQDNISDISVNIDNINSDNVNLYNKEELISNSFVDKTGTINDLHALYRTDYIDIHDIISIRLLNKIPSSSGDKHFSPLCCFYDFNKNFLNYVEITKVGDVEIQIPTNAYYVIINFHLTYLDEYYIYKYKKIEWLITDNTKKTKGKIMNCVGDSLTAYSKWQPTVVENLGLSEYKNLALAGGYLTTDMAQYLENLDTSVDIITIWAGTNDWSYGKLLGSFSDEIGHGQKYIPTLRYMIEYICKNRPMSKLFLITPHQRFCNSPAGSPNTDYTLDEKGNYKNVNGDTLEDFANAIIEVGKYYSIPVIDLNHKGIVNKINYSNYLVDKIHHNENGGILHGTIISNEMLRYF